MGAPADPVPAVGGIAELLAAAARTWAGRPAVSDHRVTVPYDELWSQVRECADWIRGAGLPAPLILVPSNTAHDVVAIFAAIVAGACPLIADRTWTATELDHVRRSTGAGAVLGRAEVQPPGVTPVVPTWRGLAIGSWDDDPGRPAADLDGIAFGRFSSGTTGGSRCLGFTQTAAVAAAAAWRSAARLSVQDTVLCLATLNNGLAFNTSLLAVLGAGARLVLHAGRPIPSSIARVVRTVRPTVLVAFPFAFDALTKDDRLERGALRLAVSSAAALPEPTQLRWTERTGLGICDYYGLVETGPVTFNDGSVPGSVGYPLPGSEVVIDADPTRPGRVLVRTPSMAARYLDGRPPALADSVTTEGFYRTGDLGFIDRHGHLTLSGRVGTVVNVAGRKIDPAEVSAVIRSVPGVRDVLVRGERPPTGEILAAYVEGSGVTREAVVRACRLGLADYKLPQRIVIRPVLPRSASGKVAAARLAEISEPAPSEPATRGAR